MSEPWYKDGLRFQCTECGDCCTGDPGYVWVSDAELADIAAFRGETLAEVRGLWTKSTRRGLSLREKENGDCVFLGKNKGCTIYPVRPRQCRTWPFWESNLVTPEHWRQTCEVCPGSGQGTLISSEEITKRLQVIRL